MAGMIGLLNIATRSIAYSQTASKRGGF